MRKCLMPILLGIFLFLPACEQKAPRTAYYFSKNIEEARRIVNICRSEPAKIIPGECKSAEEALFRYQQIQSRKQRSKQ